MSLEKAMRGSVYTLLASAVLYMACSHAYWSGLSGRVISDDVAATLYGAANCELDPLLLPTQKWCSPTCGWVFVDETAGSLQSPAILTRCGSPTCNAFYPSAVQWCLGG